MAEPQIRLGRAAFASMYETLRTALPKEAGGVLVGWRDGAHIVVVAALPVADVGARTAHYVRRHAAASEALNSYLETATDPLAGYVGEWHTHPVSAPPSQTDKESIVAVASQIDAPIALVVLAWDRTRGDVDLHGVSARRMEERVILALAHCVRLEVNCVDG
ncbi:Mov34/MPN/PAD-1 family protein [Streptomyces sp. RG80]|uniref:Mov34/MPN/PAD-1 family protein n=1 Tax=Streptomyces sp. RG80 TaxID=3157340 RepID=UPI00338F848C